MRGVIVFTALALPLPAARADDPAPDPAAVRTAISRSLPLLQDGAESFRERSEGKCISCHHQGLILPTVALARERGLAVVEKQARAEVERVHGFYARRRDLHERALTDPAAARRADAYGNFTVHVGCWLWGLAAENVPPDAVTGTAARLLAAKQLEDGHWSFEDGARAPMQAGDFTTTALAVFVLQHYGPKEPAEATGRRIARAREWLLKNRPRTTDDKAFRLFGLDWARAGDEERKQAARQLLADQRAEGGWAQQDNMPGDAYATGLALVSLHRAGGLAVSEPAYRRGVTHLLRTQWEDGSWFVKTRAIPSNPYFESGFPYGKSQFISYAGTCWATMALTLTVDRARSKDAN
jgi:N-acyl-D-amino-acid deacylase